MDYNQKYKGDMVYRQERNIGLSPAGTH